VWGYDINQPAPKVDEVFALKVVRDLVGDPNLAIQLQSVSTWTVNNRYATRMSHGRVFCICDEFLNTPAPTLLQGLDALAFAIHPEIFPDTKGIRRITDVGPSTVSKSTP